MDSDSRIVDQDKQQEEDRGGILRQLEEKLDRLLGPREDDWHERAWAPLDSPFVYYGAGNPPPASSADREPTPRDGASLSRASL